MIVTFINVQLCNNHKMWVLHKLSKAWCRTFTTSDQKYRWVFNPFTTTVVEVGLNEIYVHSCVKVECRYVTGSKNSLMPRQFINLSIHTHTGRLLSTIQQTHNTDVHFRCVTWLGLQTLSWSQPSWFEAPCMWNSRWNYDFIFIPNFIIQNEYIYIYPGSIPI